MLPVTVNRIRVPHGPRHVEDEMLDDLLVRIQALARSTVLSFKSSPSHGSALSFGVAFSFASAARRCGDGSVDLLEAIIHTEDTTPT
jgi:hypothetical protein